MNHDKCIHCQSPLRIILSKVFDTRFGVNEYYDITECPQCGWNKLHPMPSQEQLKALYEKYYNFEGEAHTRYTRWRDHFYHSYLYRVWLAIDGDIAFHQLRGHGRLLDIGCNEGRGLKLFQSHGFSVEGLELNATAAAVARQKGFVIHEETIENFYPAVLFDNVVLSNVIEHAINPRDMLLQAHRLLNSKGKVLISCPNGQSFLRRLFGRYWINWHVPFHINLFTAATLNALLTETGFNVITCRQETPAIWVTQSIISRCFAKFGKPTRQIRNPLLVLPLLGLIRGLLFPLWWILNKMGKGDCLVVIAQKGLT